MVGKSKEDLMATIKELYDLCKKKQKSGEKLGFLLKAFVEEYEKEYNEQAIKEVTMIDHSKGHR